MSIHDELQELMSTMAEAYRAGDAAGCASLFVQNGELYSPYAPPARGRAAIEALHQEWTRGGENKQLTVIAAGSSGDLAWCHTAYGKATSRVMARR